MERRLAVIETEWWSGYSHTVRPFFEGMSYYIHDDERSDGFYYERFVGQGSFKETLEFLVKKKDVRYLYIASHGGRSALECPNKDSIKRSELQALLANANRGTQLDGLLLGSCLIGNEGTARKLLTSELPAPQRLKWVAGYEQAVDWLKGSLLDVMFLTHILIRAVKNGQTPSQAVKSTCRKLQQESPGLLQESGFHVYVRQQKTGDIVDLFREMHDDSEG